jgi:uncharacterized protein with NRDE domain
MCLIVVGWQVHPDFPLVVAANRDEFHARRTAAAQRWPDLPEVIGGRDLEAGGTWLGITTSGRFAAVTNVREPAAPQGRRSRGELTRAYLAASNSPADYVQGLAGDDYSGFNLLLADRESLWYCSNRAEPCRLEPGIYGLSNHLLDSPWPKLLSARTRFAEALADLPDRAGMFAILSDDEIVPDAELPSTGVPLEWERLLSAIFVRSERYGTRASTVVMRDVQGMVTLEELSFEPSGAQVQVSLISTGV